jgi:hypothetical protein
MSPRRAMPFTTGGGDLVHAGSKVVLLFAIFVITIATRKRARNDHTAPISTSMFFQVVI